MLNLHSLLPDRTCSTDACFWSERSFPLIITRSRNFPASTASHVSECRERKSAVLMSSAGIARSEDRARNKTKKVATRATDGMDIGTNT